MSAPGTSTGFDVTITPLHPGTMLLAVSGDLDAYTVATLRASLEQLRVGDNVVLDLSRVPLVDSAGLGALIAAVRRVRNNRGHASVVCSRTSVVRMLRVTGFDRIVPLHASVDDALTAAAG